MTRTHSLVLAATLLLVAACSNGAVGAGASSSSASPASATATRTPSPTASSSSAPASTSAAPGLPHFASPAEAGTYLAEKWNAKDDTDLHHITNDASRSSLADMRTFATNLKLDTCTKNADLTYTCVFTHGFLPGKSDPDAVPTTGGHDGPAATGDPHHGRTALKAVAVSRTGWYFNAFLYCG